MKNIIFPHTDLALEIQDELNQETIKHQKNKKEDYGYTVKERLRKEERIRETMVIIENEQGAQLFRKPKGNYLTLENADLSRNDGDYHIDMSDLLAEHLEHFMKGKQSILFAGLGNGEVTPDALGPLVIKNLLITKHIHNLPLFEKMRCSMAIAPGVMAQTGIETSELLKSIIETTRPDMLVVIDALAAKTIDRLYRTVQLCDSGITPGAGVGNHRKEISKRTMGIPVLAIGVPTVISLPAISSDIIRSFLECSGDNPLLHAVNSQSERNFYDYMAQSLPEELFSFMVTPKDIDASVKRISYTISEGINQNIARKNV